jgi:hypothetical protein
MYIYNIQLYHLVNVYFRTQSVQQIKLLHLVHEAIMHYIESHCDQLYIGCAHIRILFDGSV